MYSYARQLYDYDRTQRRVADGPGAADFLPALHRIIEKTRERITEVKESNIYVPQRVASILKGTFEFMRNSGGGLAFLEVLRDYEMPASDRKVIERAAKTFSKTRIVVKPENALETAEKLLYEWQEAVDTAFSVMRKNERHKDEGSSTVLTVGSFQLVNTGGFPQKSMAESAKVVEKAEKLLRQKGLSKVCYGDVYVTNTVHRSTRTLAFYMLNDDRMYVRANLKGKLGPAVTSVVHELGHRLQFKFLKSKKREIDAMYVALKRKVNDRLHDLVMDRSLWPKEGDTTEYRGETFVFHSIDLTSRANLVALFSHPEMSAKLKVPLSGYIAEKYPEKLKGASTFVTNYAGTDPDENFAEMVAFYCEDRLPADQEPMLTAILH